MYGLLIKKAFFDMWDNLLATLIINIGFVTVILGVIFIPDISPLFTDSLFLHLFVIFITIFIRIALIFVYMGAASSLAKMITDYEKVNFKYFFKSIKETYKPSILFALVNSLFIFFSFYALSYYYNIESIFGVVLFTIVFWISIIWICSSQYFFPLQSRMDKIFKKNLRKMFYMFLDNAFFTILLFFITILSLALSFFTFLLIPGIAFVMILLNTGLKLRLLKYDYLEENPDANPKKIPWDTLVTEERKRVGKRTLKGMIFPWKD